MLQGSTSTAHQADMKNNITILAFFPGKLLSHTAYNVVFFFGNMNMYPFSNNLGSGQGFCSRGLYLPVSCDCCNRVRILVCHFYSLWLSRAPPYAIVPPIWRGASNLVVTGLLGAYRVPFVALGVPFAHTSLKRTPKHPPFQPHPLGKMKRHFWRCLCVCVGVCVCLRGPNRQVL